MKKFVQSYGVMVFSISILTMTVCADEKYFFWYGTAPASVSWAPFSWDGQGNTSGFANATVTVGAFYNHTPDAADDANLNRSLTFLANRLDPDGNPYMNLGAHHPTVLPGGMGKVSIWVYFDNAAGLGLNGQANSIYLSKNAGADLVKDNYLGVVMSVGGANAQIVSKTNATGVAGPAIKVDNWNHLVFTDDGKTTTLQVNDTDAGLSLSSGGNLIYINIVEGIVQSDGTIKTGDCPETYYIDDIECTSATPSGYEFIDVPATSNTVTIDGVINPAEVAGAKSVYWDGVTTERPGVHAQFWGQWALPTKEDFNATAYLQNNGTKLYISVDVNDDIVSLTGNANWWNDDTTEIYVDYDNSHSTAGTVQISLTADSSFSTAEAMAAWLNVMSVVKPSNKGWQVETEIDMATQGLQQGQTYGFDIAIDESDGENPANAQGAQEWIYSTYEDAYNNETYWANIRILSTPLTRILGWDVY